MKSSRLFGSPGEGGFGDAGVGEIQLKERHGAARGTELVERLAVQRAGEDGNSARGGGGFGLRGGGGEPGGAAQEQLRREGFGDGVALRGVGRIQQGQGDALFAAGADFAADRLGPGGDGLIGDDRDPA